MGGQKSHINRWTEDTAVISESVPKLTERHVYKRARDKRWHRKRWYQWNYLNEKARRGMVDHLWETQSEK